MNRGFFHAVTLILLVLILQACSAGGGETGTGQTDTDTSVSVGVITGFGSVFVNGVKFKTSDNTVVSVDGDSAALESHLAVGMLVTVSGNVNSDGVNGVASSILFEDNVEGVVISSALFDSTGNTINVLGQTVFVDNDTIFDSKDSQVTLIEQVTAGHIIEVSGYSNGDGNIFATRIELKKAAFQAGDTIEIKGIAQNVTSTSFMIGSMTVTYLSENLKGFDSTFGSGDFVSVKSTKTNIGTTLEASEVEFKDGNHVSIESQSGKEIEFEGIVSNINTDTNTFLLNSETILVNSMTNFDNDNFNFSNLVNKSKVKVHGRLNEAGQIVAESLRVKEVSVNYIEGNITSINFDEQSIVLQGVTIYINNSTRLKDDLEESDSTPLSYDKQYFKFSDLKANDNVQVTFFTDTNNGSFIASKLERENDEDEVGTPGEPGSGKEREIEGVITSIDLNNKILVVSGITIKLDNLILDDYAALLEMDTVEVHGLETPNGWFATEIDVKGEPDDSLFD